MSRFLIAEPGHTGHVFVYIALMARYAQAEGHDVHCIISREGLESVEFAQHLAELSDLSIHSTSGPPTLDRIALASTRMGADIVVIPNGDLYVPDIARRGWGGDCPLRVLVMRDPRWENPRDLRRRWRLMAKRALIAMTCARGAEVIWLRQPGYSGPERHANDPVITGVPISEVLQNGGHFRESLRMDSTTYWFGMTGAISTHKNLPLVLDSLRRLCSNHPTDKFGFALIGPLNPGLEMTEEEILRDLGGLPIPTRRLGDVMTNDEMNAVVAALDCVIMAYSSSSPNSTLGKAAAFGTRVAAAGDRSIERFVGELGMGPTAQLESGALARLLAAQLGKTHPEPRPELLADRFSQVLMASARGG